MVVAACTPRTHEPLFRDTLREGGINQYFFDMANIREHCSWVHSKQKEEATGPPWKAWMSRPTCKDLIRQVYQHRLIHVSHGATITDASGYVGNFVTTRGAEGQTKTIQHGATILATGAAEHKPTEYLYGEDDRV